MNKAELIDHLSEATGVSKADTERVLNAAIETIKTTVKKQSNVTLVGFGTFTRIKRKARAGRHPRTGKPIRVPALTMPKFRPGKAFREFLN